MGTILWVVFELSTTSPQTRPPTNARDALIDAKRNLVSAALAVREVRLAREEAEMRLSEADLGVEVASNAQTRGQKDAARALFLAEGRRHRRLSALEWEDTRLGVAEERMRRALALLEKANAQWRTHLRS